jgi:hypothetical protein
MRARTESTESRDTGPFRGQSSPIETDPESPKPEAPAPKPGIGAALPAETAPGAHALSPEEQMALFEKELKENDWGHQPC